MVEFGGEGGNKGSKAVRSSDEGTALRVKGGLGGIRGGRNQ